MSTTTHTFAPAQLGARLTSTIAAQWAALMQARKQRAVFHQVRTQLNAMSDRDLADIGTNRLLINEVAQRAAFGETDR